ncbi:hypothetical protein [Cyclobacterium xiamenense]|uniref:hypothetical protein n=1 Tax=Cyclobacterium xiamenense TaxID=1297121 RepID=UPI0035CFDA42
MKLSLLLALTIVVFLGCVPEKETTFMGERPVTIKFEKSYSLDGTLASLETLGAQNIHILDSLMVITTPQRDTLYNIRSLHNLGLEKNFIRKGEGPNEFENLLRPLSAEKKGNDVLISFYHKARQGIFYFNLTQSWYGEIDIFMDTVKLKKLNEIYRAYKIDDERVFIDNMDFLNLNQLYSVYQLNDQQITRLDTALKSGLNDQQDSYLMASVTVFNKLKRKYAGGMMFMDQLNIYDIENPDNSISITTNKNVESLSTAAKASMPLKNEYYVDLRDGNGFLFGLYANLSRKEWAIGNSPAEVHVIDWDGNPTCKLIIKEKLLHICIDSANNLLFGLTEKDEIYTYDLDRVPELQ